MTILVIRLQHQAGVHCIRTSASASGSKRVSSPSRYLPLRANEAVDLTSFLEVLSKDIDWFPCSPTNSSSGSQDERNPLALATILRTRYHAKQYHAVRGRGRDDAVPLDCPIKDEHEQDTFVQPRYSTRYVTATFPDHHF